MSCGNQGCDGYARKYVYCADCYRAWKEGGPVAVQARPDIPRTPCHAEAPAQVIERAAVSDAANMLVQHLVSGSRQRAVLVGGHRVTDLVWELAQRIEAYRHTAAMQSASIRGLKRDLHDQGTTNQLMAAELTRLRTAAEAPKEPAHAKGNITRHRTAVDHSAPDSHMKTLHRIEGKVSRLSSAATVPWTLWLFNAGVCGLLGAAAALLHGV